MYQVVLSGQSASKLKDLHHRAKEKGQGGRFLSATKKILTFLRTEPLHFGEPRFALKNLSLEVRVAAVSPLLVVYGVHEGRRLVFIRDILRLPGTDF